MTESHNRSRIDQWKSRYYHFKKQYPHLHQGAVIFLWVIYAVMLLYGIFYMSVYFSLFEPIPGKETLTHIQNHTASEVYSSDGELLGRYFVENRTNTTLSRVSPKIIDALIATEDKRFHEHDGVDKKSMARVLFKTILGGQESAGGGSTITQQLAKNLYPRRDYGILSLPVAKVKEAIIARRLEDIYSKEQILEFYLNTVSFGEDVYGIETATNRFFNRAPDSIKVEQAAILIGMLKATTTYNPRLNPENSWNRRNVVLEQMGKYEYLSPEVVDSLQETQLQLDYNYRHYSEDPAAYFREYIKNRLEEWCSNHRKLDGTAYNLYTDGLRITTTINSRMQQYAEEAVTEHLRSLQSTFNRHWQYRSLWKSNPQILKDAMRNSQRYSNLKARGFSEEEIDSLFNAEVPMNIFEWKGEISTKMSPLDSIKHYVSMLNAGFTAIEPETGHVKAWVGGINHKYFQYDQVAARRQVGSTFKPLVYATAIQHGIEPCEYIENTRETYEQYQDWTPRNAGGNYGGMYSVQGALVNSINVVSVKLIMEVGIGSVINMARKMGIEGDLPRFPSIALGASDVSLDDMVEAYTTFPNRGYSVKPSYILKIESREGRVLESFNEAPEKTQVMYSKTADIITYILQQVVRRGTGARLAYHYGLRNEIAGKTGTTQSHADGWFIGFTPQLVAGARVGASDQRVHFRSLKLGQGANMALPVVGKFYLKVLRDKQLPYKWSAKFHGIRDTMSLADLNCPDYKEKPRELSPWEEMWWDLKNIFGPDEMREKERDDEKDDENDGSIFDIFKGDKEKKKEREKKDRERQRDESEKQEEPRNSDETEDPDIDEPGEPKDREPPKPKENERSKSDSLGAP